MRVLEGNNSITIQTATGSATSSCVIAARDLERPAIWHLAQAKYIQGYDVISIEHNNPKVVREISQALIGLIVTEETAKRITLTSIVSTPETSFERVLRRTAHILVEHARLLNDITTKKITLQEVKQHEKQLDAHLLYCLRYLNKYVTVEKAYQYFLITLTFEQAGDDISRIAEHIGSNKELAQLLIDGIDQFTLALFEKNFEKFYKTTRGLRNKIKTKTFVDGLAISLAELLYNYAGFMVE